MVLVFFFLPLLIEEAAAQMSAARYAYVKKYRITGLVELTYRDYGIESKYDSKTSKSDYSTFEQRYKLGLTGYVYHPKLVSFAASVTFRKEDGDLGAGGDYGADTFGYDFSLSVLPLNPVSLNIYALRSDSTIEGWGASPFSITSNYYGARFRFTKRKYPFVVVEYSHLDFTIERERGILVYDPREQRVVLRRKPVKEESSIDRYFFNVYGSIKSLRTRYTVAATYSEFSNPSRSYDGINVTATTYTTFKVENWLSTSLQFYDIDTYKRKMFATNLRLAPIGRLYHSYRYGYEIYETENEKRHFQTFGNNLLYKYSRFFSASTRLLYGYGKRDGMREESYDINAALHYNRPLKTFEVTSYYRFAFSKEQRRREHTYMNNSVGVGFVTRKFLWGTLYGNYDFAISNYNFSYALKENDFFDWEENGDYEVEKISAEGDSMEHRVRVGLRGKGPRRVYWNVEAEGRIYDSEIRDHKGTVFWLGEEQWAEKIRHYTVTGDIGYPFGRRGLATAKASYTTGQTNSEDIERYFYEFHVNYRIFRNLNALAWWREDWRNRGWWTGRPLASERVYGWKTREYEIELRYVIRRITFTVEYNVYRYEEGRYASEYRRLLLRARRPF